MSESQEQLIARLTELAKKAWPHLRDVVVIDGSDVDGSAQIVARSAFPATTFDGTPFADDYVTTVLRVPGRAASGARAIDALEAALCVLADEPLPESCMRDCDGYWQQHKRAVSAEHEMAERCAAWKTQLERLTSELNEKANTIEAANAMVIETCDVADQLKNSYLSMRTQRDRLRSEYAELHSRETGQATRALQAEHELTELRARLEAMAAEWRVRGDRRSDAYDPLAEAPTLDACADDVEAALASADTQKEAV